MPNETSVKAHDQEALLFRLTHGLQEQRRSVVFLFGSALTQPLSDGQPGVPSTVGIIDLVRGQFSGKKEQLAKLESALSGNTGNRYQIALDFLGSHYGQNSINELVRKAVWNARMPLNADSELHYVPGAETLDETCALLESDTGGWYLNPGVDAVGQLVAGYPDIFGRSILTSNFDPLVEVAIKANRGRYYRTVLHGDGFLDQTRGDGCHIVHFHGYWFGSDTLHTPQQLQQERPRLKASLADLLRGSILVVIGYGGWDDILSKALIEVIADDHASPEVLWTTRGTPADLNPGLLSGLQLGMGRGRVHLYESIECNTFLQALLGEWKRKSEPTQLAAPSSIEKVTPTNLNHDETPARQTTISVVNEPRLQNASKPNMLRKALAKSRVILRLLPSSSKPSKFVCDNPPDPDFWVGRKRELEILDQSKEPVVIITGLGGEGKSLLASRYVKQSSGLGRKFSIWDWRDCKEQRNRFHTQLLGVVERLAGGRIRVDELGAQDTSVLVDLLLRNLPSPRPVIVFDNIDMYIGVETLELTGGPKMLAERVLQYQADCQVVFTCRPSVSYGSPSVLVLPLSGFSFEETKQLFNERGNRVENESHLVRLHDLTRGHAFWVDLIAAQTARRLPGITLEKLLADIEKGSAPLPQDTILSIWNTIRPDERTILRTLAEAVRPANEAEIHRYTENRIANYNRYSRALRSLQSLNLLVRKPRDSSNIEYELHPLVREFVRKTFPKRDRTAFIDSIAGVYLKEMESHKTTLAKGPPLFVLQMWAEMVELEIHRERWDLAFTTLDECSDALVATGHNEEFVRLAERLLEAANWNEAVHSIKVFDDIVESLARSLTHLGRRADAVTYLNRYNQSISAKDARFIHYCNLMCYVNWFSGDFVEAIAWGKKGSDLKQRSGVDTGFDTEHNLALARRDAGHLDLALKHFLQGQSVEKVLDPSNVEAERGGPYYGNIGRCLQLMGQLAPSLICYRKSARLLEKLQIEQHILQNQAYVRQWVAEVLEKTGDLHRAILIYKAAQAKWELVSPSRSDQMAKCIDHVLARIDDRTIGDASDIIAEAEFAEWIGGAESKASH